MEDTLVQLDPNTVISDSNIRHALLKHRVERLKQQIIDSEGVRTPIEVTALPTGDPSGKAFRVITGGYRTEAVQQLVKEGYSLTLPAIVRDWTPQQILSRQIQENQERENLSPIDMAKAARMMLDSGSSKKDVRVAFARPRGKKGLKVEEASNAWLNITLSFLELPKTVQDKIHDGRIGFNAAYELMKYPLDKRQAIIDKIEKDRISQIDREDLEEVKFLDAEKKRIEADEKDNKIAKSLEVTQTELEAAEKLAKDNLKAEAYAYAASKDKALDEKAKKVAIEKFKAAQAATKSAEKIATDKKKEAEKLAAKLKEKEEKSKALKAKLDKAKASAAKNKGTTKPVSQKEVQKAATDAGVEREGLVKLNAGQMRSLIQNLMLPSGYPKVQAIAKVLNEAFDGKWTPAQATTGLAKLTGEYVADKGKK